MKISKEVKTGLVVIVTLVAFYSLYNFLKGKDLFSEGNTYYIKYDDVKGLAPSKPVTLQGLKVGRVEDIQIINDRGPVYLVATIKLNKKIDFSKNTIAQIHEPGMMSGAEIQLLLDYNGEIAQNGDTLRGEMKSSLLDSFSKDLEPTKMKLDSLLLSTNSAMSGVNRILDEENQNSLKEILKSLDTTLKSFGQTSQSLTQTSNSANQMINDNNAQLKSTLASAQEAMDKFGNVADKMNNLELEKIMRNFEESSVKLNNIMAQIDNGEGTLGSLVNDRELYENLTNTSKTLDALLLDFKENPNRYVQFSIFGKKQPK